MESALPLVTRLRNDTGHSIDFSAGSCRIPRLAAGGRRLVNLSKIIAVCRRRRSISWPIKVLIDDKFTGMTLTPQFFFDYVQISFKILRNETFSFIAEGVKEKINIDMLLRLSRIGCLLGRNRIWSGRQCTTLVDFPLNMQIFEIDHPQSSNDRKRVAVEHNWADPNMMQSMLKCRMVGQKLLKTESDTLDFHRHRLHHRHHLAYDHQPSFNIPNHFFVFIFALLLVSFVHMLLGFLFPSK